MPFEGLIVGNAVKEEQFLHVWEKLVPDEMSTNGKEVREVQLRHA